MGRGCIKRNDVGRSPCLTGGKVKESPQVRRVTKREYGQMQGMPEATLGILTPCSRSESLGWELG